MSNYIEIAEQTMLGDLMKCVIEQVKVLPKAWNALSENEQREYLDRVQLQVSDAVRQSVSIIASHDQINVPAKVDSVTFKDGCKVVLKALGGIENTIHLAEAEGQLVSVIIPTDGLMSEEGLPTPEPDQRGLELGHEYDEDAELEDGFMPDNDEIEPLHPDDDADPLYEQAVTLVRKENKATITLLQRELKTGYNRAARLIEAMERAAIVSTADADGKREVYPEISEDDSDDGIDHSDEYEDQREIA